MTRWFRKHSKIMMVFLAVFAMAIFGLGDTIMQFARGGAPQNENFKDEVIATWGDNQEIKQSNLSQLLERHYQVQRFLDRVIEVSQSTRKDYRPLAPKVAEIQGDQRASRSFVNEQLVDRFILARKAEKEGLIYTDAMVDDYLDLLSGQAGFSQLQLTQMNRDANPGRVPFEVVRRHLRQELMAQQMQILSNSGYQLVSNPTEGTELYQQYSELVQCDVMPVSVDQFSSLGETVSAIELKKLYDQGKYDFRDPSGKRPGFKRPNRVAVQYIMADIETFMQNEINKLTAEQVQAKYERLVAAKDNLVMEDVPREETPAAQPNSSNGSPPATGAPETTPQTPATPPAETPATPPAAETPEQSSPPTPGEEDKPGDQSSSGLVDSDFQFVSLPQDDDDKPQDPADEPAVEAPATETPATETPEKEAPAAEAGAPATEPTASTQTPMTETPAGQAAPAQTDPIANPPTANPASNPAAAPQDTENNLFADENKPQRRVKPLVDMADQIKRGLVREAVNAKIEKEMKIAEEELGYHQDDLLAWEAIDPKTRGDQPKMDYQELAKRLGLVAGETELVDYNTLGETALGKSIFLAGNMPVSIADRIFGDYDRMNKNVAERQVDFLTKSQYVYWLKDKEDAESVSFEECKDEVEKFWKQSRMVEAATKKAQTIADEINNTKASLKEKYGEKVSGTGEFAWFNTFGQPGYGQPLGVNSAGAEFMKSVFALETKQAGVAVNSDQTVVFVVQMISERKPIESLGVDYVENQYLPKKDIPDEVGMLMRQYAQGYNYDWNQEFHDEMGLKFLGQ